jgi:carbonic anhydrase
MSPKEVEMTSGLTRRRLVRSGVVVAAAGPVAALAACGGGDSSAASTTTPHGRREHRQAHKRPASPEAALEQLMAGNKRYTEGRTVHDTDESVRRVALAEEQKPYAAILGCADSRVPPEVIFDQGLGDLFVVRIAGNTAQDPLVVGSVEYAAEHLGSILLMVLGHQNCGAVKAAVATVTEGAHQEGEIQSFVDPIVPVVKKTKRKSPKASKDEHALVEQSIQANVKNSVDELSHSGPLLEHLVEKGKLKIVGGEYDLKSGKVQVL